MQLQNGYVNDYVVIIFEHYINPCRAGLKPETVTWASFFVRVGRGVWWFLVARELAVVRGLVTCWAGQRP